MFLGYQVFPWWHGTKSLAIHYLNFTHFSMVIFSMFPRVVSG